MNMSEIMYMAVAIGQEYGAVGKYNPKTEGNEARLIEVISQLNSKFEVLYHGPNSQDADKAIAHLSPIIQFLNLHRNKFLEDEVKRFFDSL